MSSENVSNNQNSIEMKPMGADAAADQDVVEQIDEAQQAEMVAMEPEQGPVIVAVPAIEKKKGSLCKKIPVILMIIFLLWTASVGPTWFIYGRYFAHRSPTSNLTNTSTPSTMATRALTINEDTQRQVGDATLILSMYTTIALSTIAPTHARLGGEEWKPYCPESVHDDLEHDRVAWLCRECHTYWKTDMARFVNNAPETMPLEKCFNNCFNNPERELCVDAYLKVFFHYYMN